MGENEPRPRAKGQAHCVKILCAGISNVACLKSQRNRTLPPFPDPRLSSGIPIGKAGLAEHRMLVGDALSRALVDFDSCYQSGAAGSA